MLPSQREWTDSIALRLLSGDKLVLTAPPLMGKSVAAERVLAALGESAVLVEGRAFTENAQVEQRDYLIARVREVVDQVGGAQLIFDDFDRALRRSGGARLQANLVSLLIDSAVGRDVGALFLSRLAGPIHLSTSGSPLMSRCVPVYLPTWTDSDALANGLDPLAVEQQIGRSARLLDHALESGRLDYDAPFHQIKIASDRIADDIARAGHAEALRVGGEPPPAVLAGMINDDGSLTALFRDVGIADALESSSTSWPEDLRESARQFAELTAGANSITWVDRYLYKRPSDLEEFLRAVRQDTDTPIRLLGSKYPGAPIDPSRVAGAVASVPSVQARIMRPQDVSPLHDRHLVLRGLDGGWVLPTSDVILTLAPAGSAVASRVRAFPVDYGAIWNASLDLPS